MIVNTSFGALIKGLRIRNKLTLRKACELLGYDPGNFSKLERNILAPPSYRTAIDAIINPLKPSLLERELIYSAALNFHIGKLQERLS